MDAEKISLAVYIGLCRDIGTPTQVVIRRDVVDIREFLVNRIKFGHQIMESGSRREGFRFYDSDMDVMSWPDDHPVIWDFSQVEFYNTNRQTPILCDCSESPPGFTLLWLPLENTEFPFACIIINGIRYISSKLHVELLCAFSGSKVHGPCASGRVTDYESDFAVCFSSDFWPPSAYPWIDRCQSWPRACVVQNIVKSGCHFVAMGHKLGKHVDNEWRISFSQAEQKLVYSMNHTQFLVYGLMKLFLKEVINKELRKEEELLCSYHMKTAVFWAIQQNTMPYWSPQNLLAGFWICFKLLLKWVYEGVCPNFFIPENNMFLNNVHGEAQKKIFHQLYGLYKMGITSLLRSSSIRSFITNTLCNPRLSVCADESTLISEMDLDVELFQEINAFDLFTCKESSITKYFDMAERLLHLPSSLTLYQIVALQIYTAEFLQFLVCLVHKYYIRTVTTNVNKHVYVVDKRCRYMLKLAAKFGNITDMLFWIMYLYKTFRYDEALSLIKITGWRMRDSLLYGKGVDRRGYREDIGEHALLTTVKRVLKKVISLCNIFSYIDELNIEQNVSLQNGSFNLKIPHFSMIHMLEFLCLRHVEPINAKLSLGVFQRMVHCDRGVLIPVECRDISWEILGICQQMAGNLQDALYSYQQSLRQEPYHKIQNATRLSLH